MEVFPELALGWFIGWLFLAIEFLVQGALLMAFAKPVVTRLFDRSGWSNKQKLFLFSGKVFSLVCLVLIILTPLKIGSALFIAGLIIGFLGCLIITKKKDRNHK